MHIQGTPATTAFLTFIQDYSAALQNAALLLGGQLALKRVQFLVDHLSINCALTRRAKTDLVALHKLLTLQNVGDPERIETSLFATSIHPIRSSKSFAFCPMRCSIICVRSMPSPTCRFSNSSLQHEHE